MSSECSRALQVRALCRQYGMANTEYGRVADLLCQARPNAPLLLPETLPLFTAGNWRQEVVSIAVLELLRSTRDPSCREHDDRIDRALHLLRNATRPPSLEKCLSVETLACRLLAEHVAQGLEHVSSVRLSAHVAVYGYNGGTYGGHAVYEPSEPRGLQLGLLYEATLDLHDAVLANENRDYVGVACSALAVLQCVTGDALV